MHFFLGDEQKSLNDFIESNFRDWCVYPIRHSKIKNVTPFVVLIEKFFLRSVWYLKGLVF